MHEVRAYSGIVLTSLFAAFTLSACGTMPTAKDVGPGQQAVVMSRLPAPTPGLSNESAYLIGALDLLDISVFQADNLSGTYQVDNNGSIVMPLIGRIQVAGKPISAVQTQITSRLNSSFMQSPQVSVKVSGFNSQRVVVDGAVMKPGTFPVTSGSSTLLEFISTAGGMPRTADDGAVAIYRVVGNTRYVARYNVAAIRAGTAPNPQVYGGDTIVVPNSDARSIWLDVLAASPLIGTAARLAY